MSKNREATGKRGIYRKSNKLYARLGIPKDLREHFESGEFIRSLKTNDLKTAEYRAAQLFHEWKSQFDQLRGSSSAINEALQWKKILEKEKLKDADLLATFRKDNPDRGITSVDLDDMGSGSNNLGYMDYIERVAKDKGPEEAEAIANIITGNKLPTLGHLEEWQNSRKGRVIPRTIQMTDTRIKRFAKKFPSLPIKKTEVARWIIELEGEGPAEATIKGLIGSCRSYYDYLTRTGRLDSDGSNPFDRPKFTRNKKASRRDRRQAWETEDVIKLIGAAKAKTGDANLHDLILLGAFTGARLEELVRLRVEDVKEDKGIKYFSIEESKSEAGLRDLPIHNDILPLIESLVSTSKDGYLLPFEPITGNGERSSAIGKRFGRLKTGLGYDGRYVFHSLRKTLSTLLERLGLHHNQAAEITGHEKIGETYGTYSAGLTIAEKASFLNKVKYEGLKVVPKEGPRR
jgi:integrase